MEERKGNHTLLLDQRKKLSLSGIIDVLSFDEETIRLDTELGLLTVEGDNLHINRLSVDNGEMVIEGEIDSCAYSVRQKSGGSLLSRMFR
ncbi:MAG: sporulation protein YabP [Clostridia bacterium]|nr:sporulation protein YabP [Clostridia bacterium]